MTPSTPSSCNPAIRSTAPGVGSTASTSSPRSRRRRTVRSSRRWACRWGGASWAADMFLRYSPERVDADLAYVKDMGLNTVRLEGRIDHEEFFDKADRLGILLMPGWTCCDAWERWKSWKPEQHKIAGDSLRDQIRILRNHPSVFVWLYGSDGPPPADVETMYLVSRHVIQAIPRTATFQLSATDQSGTTATVSTTAVSATASGGFSWGTLATAVVAALFIGSLVGGLFASRRRPAAPKISVYSAVQRRIEQERTHS